MLDFQVWLKPASVMLMAVLCITGCSKEPIKVFVPPRPQPQPQVIADMKPPPLVDAPPEIEVASIDSPEFPLANLPELPVPPKQPATRRNTPAAPKPAPPATAATPAPPKITAILTPDQRREKNRQLDEYLGNISKALETLAGKRNLTAEQGVIAEQIRTFYKQAGQERVRDLETAVSLAKRADDLAKDLIPRLP